MINVVGLVGHSWRRFRLLGRWIVGETRRHHKHPTGLLCNSIQILVGPRVKLVFFWDEI